MQWLLDNWIIVLLVGGMIGMHLFGHGGHGGGHRRGKHKQGDAETTDDVSGKTRPHSPDNKVVAPRVSGDRTALVPGQATQNPKTADEP